jgi:RNA polymerase sigma-70 factor (ECF subfamily)
MKDSKLIEKLKNDDSIAFDIIFKKYYKPLVNYIRSVSQDIYMAEDVVQNVFMNLWLNRCDLKINKTLKGYLYWVSYTTYINQYRKTKHREHLLDDIKEMAIRDALPEDKELTNKRVEKLKQLIETLPPVCKEVLELNKIKGLKYDEIAKRLNISKKTVESHMRVAFKKIRKGFESYNMFLFFIKNLP